MITLNIDNLTAFYLGMSILTLAFAIIAVFGKTEENSNRKAKRTTTS